MREWEMLLFLFTGIQHLHIGYTQANDPLPIWRYHPEQRVPLRKVILFPALSHGLIHGLRRIGLGRIITWNGWSQSKTSNNVGMEIILACILRL